ncbi:glycosyltransferase family 1 protein [Calidifontibacter sp. DB0510]|uniref:D-inositol 3-phosphate glycosyltransferase n=1 Tax=Metallococcus carri TaxID=1656884 RepID=A0A967E8Y6_9MICO|nr:glycosyltransferase [Metallococcus carri]NHN54660.1 glycosyltransferase family 1 protein [Metallococcus carri]NOP37005.1 glycosyltransferase [Calidifontibacter sp. DB2511S]
MKIAMVSEHASPLAALGGVDAGGQNVHVAALATQLARRGHEVRVYTRRDQPESQQPERVALNDGVEVVHVPAGPARAIPKDELLPFMGAFGDWLSEDWARTGTPDVVHAHFWMSGLAAAQACALPGIPWAITFHALGVVKRRHQGLADTSPPQRLELERRLASTADLIIATCSDEAAELTRLGAPADRIAVVPCGVDTMLFSPAAAPRPPRSPAKLLSVGRLVPRKGLDTAVRALVALPHTELTIAGGPPRAELDQDAEARRLRELADALGVGDRVLFTGQVAHERMPELYRSADLVLATPWYEPFGITPLEAAACGKAVVGSAVGGLLDTVVDGQTGRLVPERDPRALASAIAEMLDCPETLADWGRTARARAVTRYGWERVAERTEASLLGVVRGRRAVEVPA